MLVAYKQLRKNLSKTNLRHKPFSNKILSPLVQREVKVYSELFFKKLPLNVFFRILPLYQRGFIRNPTKLGLGTVFVLVS